MIIENRKINRDAFFILRFRDEQEFNIFISTLRCITNVVDADEERLLMNIINSLKSRTDDKYATEEYGLSGVLYVREFMYLAEMLPCVIGLLNQVYNTLSDYQLAIKLYQSATKGYQSIIMDELSKNDK